jgi:hypothetical protein
LASLGLGLLAARQFYAGIRHGMGLRTAGGGTTGLFSRAFYCNLGQGFDVVF